MAAGADLPYVDEHAVEIGAPPERVWAALGDLLSTSFAGRTAAARALGARPAEPSGDPLTEGATVPGFRVAVARPAEQLALAGRHRFSRYALIFRLDPAAGGTRLRAETRAVFPGPHGAAYRALVIGTRGHIVAVRRMLAAIRRRAER